MAVTYNEAKQSIVDNVTNKTVQNKVSTSSLSDALNKVLDANHLTAGNGISINENTGTISANMETLESAIQAINESISEIKNSISEISTEFNDFQYVVSGSLNELNMRVVKLEDKDKK